MSQSHINFPARLRAMRKHAGLTQQQLSDKLAPMGVRLSRSMVTRCELGYVTIKAVWLLPIAEACGLGWEDWVKREENQRGNRTEK